MACSGDISIIPWSFKLFPKITYVAISAKLYLVTFDKNGTVLDDLGFTSIIYTFSSLSTINWILNKPIIPIPNPNLVVYSLIVSFTFSLILKVG